MPYPVAAARGQISSVVSLLPFSDAFTRSDGAIGNNWESSGATWTISSNKVINTPSVGSELIVNGGFGADTDWTKGTDWSIAAGVGTKAAGASASNITQDVLTTGRWYRATFSITASTAGNFAPVFGGIIGTARSAVASYRESNRASSATAGIRAGSAATAGSVDNVSYKQLTLSELFATQNFGRNDVDVSAAFTISSADPGGVVLCLDSTSSPANFVVAYHDGFFAYLVKCVGGTYTQLINNFVVAIAGAAVRVTKSGSTFKLYYNGVQRGSDQTISDAGIVSNTRHGIFSTHESNTLDDFSIAAN